MSDNVILSPAQVAFLEAMRPVAQRIKLSLDCIPLPGENREVTAEYARRHLKLIERTIARLVELENGALNSALQSNAADAPAAVRHAIGKYGKRLASLLKGYEEVGRHLTNNRTPAPRELLSRIYLHQLGEIGNHLDEIVRLLEEPQTAISRREVASDGELAVHFTATLTPAPEIRELSKFLAAQQRAVEERARHRLDARMAKVASSAQSRRIKQEQGLGLVGTLAAIWLGIELFGDDC